MASQDHKPIVVAVLGGDPVVGRALELMLTGGGYDARFLNGSFIDELAELAEEIRLVILAPGLHSKGRKRFLNGTQRAAAKIPVLELVSASDRARGDGRQGSVSWPCRVRDLRQEIDTALQAPSIAS